MTVVLSVLFLDLLIFGEAVFPVIMWLFGLSLLPCDILFVVLASPFLFCRTFLTCPVFAIALFFREVFAIDLLVDNVQLFLSDVESSRIGSGFSLVGAPSTKC